MTIQLIWDEPVPNCITWEFERFISIVDYMPYMNDSIQRAMIEQDEDFYVLLNMGWSMPFPNRSFKLVARPIIGAPPNLKRVIIASSNPLTRTLINLTLGREPMLKETLRVVGSYAAALDLLRA